jgi:hypothetical protein
VRRSDQYDACEGLRSRRVGLLKAIRVLLIQGIGGVLAWTALSVFLVLVAAFGAFVVAAGAFVAWLALTGAIIAVFVGQWRIARGDRRWLRAMTGLEALVVLTGVALEVYLFFGTAGAPPPPTLNVFLVLVLPAIALVNMALLVAAQGRHPQRRGPSHIAPRGTTAPSQFSWPHAMCARQILAPTVVPKRTLDEDIRVVCRNFVLLDKPPTVLSPANLRLSLVREPGLLHIGSAVAKPGPGIRAPEVDG